MKTITRFFLITLILVFGLGLVACATSPEGRRQLKLLPEDQVDAMGVQSFEQIKQQTTISTDKNLQNYVRCIADRIIPHVAEQPDPSKWEVVVFQDDQANAFALPGNKIGVYTGLLKYATNQDELAAVMGHEVAHVIAGHSNERVSSQLATEAGISLAAVALGGDPNDTTNQMILAGLGLGVQYGLILPFSRSHESEADLIGLDLMAKAGFDPSQSVQLWKNMSAAGSSPPEFLSTHPSNETRIKQLKERIPEAKQFFDKAVQQGQRAQCKL